MRPARRSHRARGVVVTATRIADGRFVGRTTGISAVVRARAAATRMRRRRCGVQRNRKKCSDKREQQQESGRQALHAFW